MKLDLVAIGRLKAGPERDLGARYAERLHAIGRTIGLDGPRIIEIAESQARRDGDRKTEEGAAVLSAIPAGFRALVFDETGSSLDSAAFCSMIGNWRDSGAAGVSFVIGGPDGLDSTVRARADLCISFGRMTMPHQIIRALVLEQLYRAATMLSGHPYHRA